MSEPINPLNQPLEGPTDLRAGGSVPAEAKPFIPGTDPVFSQQKWAIPGTDPVSSQAKPYMPGTDPVSSQQKWAVPGTDPLSQVALDAPGGNVRGGPRSALRGMRTALILVCVIGLVLVGGGFAVQSFLLASSAGSGTIVIQPGAVQWQHQIRVYTSAKEQLTTSGSARCAANASVGGLEERLVGGGYTADDDHGITLEAQSSYPSVSDGNWFGYFVPQAQGHLATVIAVCLREPAAFFNGLQPFDFVKSPPKRAGHQDGYLPSALAIAACPAGEAILGGGFASGYSGGGVYSIDASYPAYANGIGQWNVAFHVDPTNGLQRVQLNAYAICSKDLTTHLEQKAIAGIISRGEPSTQGAMGCASGTLLTGGYQITTPSLSLVSVGDDSPLSDTTRTPASGAFVQQWYVEASSSGWQPKVSPGKIWVTCLDTSNSATPTVTATTPTVRPTSTPRPRPTATPKPKPTNTPAPSCKSILTGTGQMGGDYNYLNVDSSTGIGVNTNGAQVEWDQASNTLLPINGAALSDKGTIGSGAFNNLTCTQLKSASYVAQSVPMTDGEVFLVKTPGGHLAKVLVTVPPAGGPAVPTLTWQTYQP